MGTGAGLDFGSRETRLLKVRADRDGRIRLLGAVVVENPSPEGVTTRARTLRQDLMAARLRPGAVNLGIPVEDSIIRYLHIPIVQPWRLNLIINYEIIEISGTTGEPIAADHRAIVIPNGKEGQLTVLLAMVKDQPLLESYTVLQNEGIGVRASMPNAIALFNAHIALDLDGDFDETTLLIDIGLNETAIAIGHGRFLSFARSVAQGSQLFVDRLASVYKCSPDEARRHLEGGPPEGKEADTWWRAMRPAFSHLGSLVEASLQFAQAQTKGGPYKPDRIYMSGGGSMAHGLTGFLTDRFGVPTHLMDPMDHLDTSALPENEIDFLRTRGPSLVTALGLAVSQPGFNGFEIELLPESFSQRRNFRSRTVWLAATACLALILVVLGFAQAVTVHSHTKTRQAKLTQQRNALEDRTSQMKKRQADIESDQVLVDRLARRSHVGYLSLGLLEHLRRSVPPDVTITKIELIKSPDPENAVGNEPYMFQVSGEVDNAAGNGTVILKALERTLENQKPIRDAKMHGAPRQTGESFLEFKLNLYMEA